MIKKLSLILMSAILAFSMSFVLIPSGQASAADGGDLQAGKLTTQASYPYLTVSMVKKEYVFTGYKITPKTSKEIKVVYHYRVWHSTKNGGYYTYHTKNVTSSCTKTYTNNLEVGTATIRCSHKGCSASANFSITKANGIKGVYSKYTSKTKTKISNPVNCKVEYNQTKEKMASFILKTIKRSTINITKTSGDAHFMLSGSGSLFNSNTQKETQTYYLNSKGTPKPGTYKVSALARSLENKNTKAVNKTINFDVTVTKANINRAEVSFHNNGEYHYSGQYITPSPYLKLDGRLLIEGRDYEITGYENNKEVGSPEDKKKPTVKVRAKKDSEYYTGSKDCYFKIWDSIKSVTLEKDSVVYNGKSHFKDIAISVKSASNKSVKAADYDIKYYRGKKEITKKNGDFTSAGTITVKVIGKNGYIGTKSAKFKIEEGRPTIDSSLTKKVSLGGKKKTSKTVSYTITSDSLKSANKTFKVTKENKNITVTKDGKATLKKGVKKGDYSVTVDISVAKTKKYSAFTIKGVKLTFKVA